MIKVIIADDDVWIREGIKNNIDWEKYDVQIERTVSNPIECLDLMEDILPDIIIMDINMPKMTGLEFLEIINRAYPTVKVIIISGYREFEYAQQAVNLNAFAFISKPVDYEGLLNVVIKAKGELEKNISKIKDNEVINIRVEQQLMILKNNYFIKLIKNNKVSELEIEEKNKMFDIKIVNQQYILLKIDLKGEEDIYLKNIYHTALIIQIEREFKDTYNTYTFYYENEIYILLSSVKINKQLVKERLKKIQSWANYNANKVIAILIGNVHFKIEELAQAYQEVELASEYQIILGKNSIIDYESLGYKEIARNFTADFSKYLLDIRKDLMLSIKNTNKEDVNGCIDQIVFYITERLEEDITKRDCLYMTLSIFIYELLIEHIGEDMLIESSEIYNKLLAEPSLSQIKQTVYQYIARVVEKLEKDKQYQSNYMINKAIHYIHLHSKESIGLVDLAEYLNIHPNYLSKIFKQVVGKAFTEYINAVKMEEAKQMLKSTNLKVYEISEKLSYNDTGYFIKIFKKVYGVSPNEYRKIIV